MPMAMVDGEEAGRSSEAQGPYETRESVETESGSVRDDGGASRSKKEGIAFVPVSPRYPKESVGGGFHARVGVGSTEGGPEEGGSVTSAGFGVGVEGTGASLGVRYDGEAAAAASVGSKGVEAERDGAGGSRDSRRPPPGAVTTDRGGVSSPSSTDRLEKVITVVNAVVPVPVPVPVLTFLWRYIRRRPSMESRATAEGFVE